MKRFILFILLVFSFAINFAVATNSHVPPDKTEHFWNAYLPDPAYCNVTEPTAFTQKFRTLRLTWFLWKEQLRSNKHENLSHEQAKMLRFNRGKETGIWDFTEDLKRKATANKTVFDTPDFMWSDSKLSLCNRNFVNYSESYPTLKQPHYMRQNSKIATEK